MIEDFLPGITTHKRCQYSINKLCKTHLSLVNTNTLHNYKVQSLCFYSSQFQLENKETKKNNDTVTKADINLSRKEKLQKAVKEYGSTVIIFHVGISLISLGTCYLLVSL